MTKFIKISIFIFFLFSFSKKMSAQTLVSNNNINTVVADLEAELGELVDISTNDITNFLSAMLNNSTNSITPPLPELHDLTANKVILKWNQVPGISTYKSGYLNLNSGANSTTTHPSSFSNLYSINNIPPDLYLFAAQSVGRNKDSRLFIIIIDKEVHTAIFDSSLGCPCEVDSDPMPIEYVTWPLVEDSRPFQLSVSNGANDLGHIKGIKVQDEIVLNLECSTEFEVIVENNLLYFQGTNQSFGIFSFEPDVNNNNLNIDFNYCKQNNGAANSKTSQVSEENFQEEQEQSLGIFPNPFKDEINIDIRNYKSDILNVELYDVTGRKVKTFDYSNSLEKKDKITLNTSSLVRGKYFCILRFNDKVEHYSIVKM